MANKKRRTRHNRGLVSKDSQWYIEPMTKKEIAIKTIQDLPDSVTWTEIEERIRFLAAIDKGLDDVKAGRVIPHEDIKESLRQWLSK